MFKIKKNLDWLIITNKLRVHKLISKINNNKIQLIKINNIIKVH